MLATTPCSRRWCRTTYLHHALRGVADVGEVGPITQLRVQQHVESNGEHGGEKQNANHLCSQLRQGVCLAADFSSANTARGGGV